MTKRQYPISTRDVAPGPEAVRLTGTRAGGGSDGLHTGGAWFYQNKVWKPLDGRPYANAQVHIETSEEDCLKALQGKPLFPKNWEVKESNGRRFIVRDKVQTFPGGGLTLTLKQLQEVQKAISEMNKAGWAINDDVVIGRDRSGHLFVLDLSNASYSESRTGPAKADDTPHVDALFKQAGFKEIVEAKQIAGEMRVLFVLSTKFPSIKDKIAYRWVYTSMKRVDNQSLVDISSVSDKLMSVDRASAKQQFWYVSKQELPESTLRKYNLTLRISA